MIGALASRIRRSAWAPLLDCDASDLRDLAALAMIIFAASSVAVVAAALVTP